ncbi:MAG: hypothetical protein ABI539_12585, partial [Acidobacteriota bacterium]
CQGAWTDESREQHYNNLCALDGRIVLANEHASRLAGWQEGSVTSALDAVTRLHARVVSYLSHQLAHRANSSIPHRRKHL